MPPEEVARLLADLCDTLSVAWRVYGDDARYRSLVTRYRAVADDLGCRDELEDALLRLVLAPSSTRDRGENGHAAS